MQTEITGKSKKAGEDLFFDYSERTGAKVLVYRFPNLFGKMGADLIITAPVATFCNNIACGLPITVSDRSAKARTVILTILLTK